MTNRICWAALLMASLLAMTSGFAFAQSGSAWGIGIWYWPDPIPPGWICDMPGQGPFSMMCWVPPRPLPPTSVCPTCFGQGGATAGHPINLTNGNTYIQETDVHVPGLGNGLTLTRTWNSTWPQAQSGTQVGLFGSNWRSTYEERIFIDSTGYLAYARSDGAFWFFESNGSNWTIASPANVGATVTAGSYWTLTFKNGEQRRFDNASGSLIAIIDRNGNTTQLTYDAVSRLTTVTDPASRHLFFTYPDNSSMLVTGVSSDVGLSLIYEYDGMGRLFRVTEPDLSTISFDYDTNSLITAVRDSDGKVLEAHTYDNHGRGLTSSRANGVDSLTVSYPNE